MNRNIALLVENAVDDKACMQLVENILNVSASLINTSHSISMQLHIKQSNHVIYCNTQGRPIYTNANSLAQQYTMSAQQPAAQLRSTVCPTYSDPVSMGAMRSDPALQYGATVRLQELENSVLGNFSSQNNKKTCGLLRAGGEASRHVYQEWPHDYVMVGPDKNRIYYKELNIEQFGYGYLSIMERQNNIIIKDNMITHLKNLFLDSMTVGFRRAKGAHAEVLTAMESGSFNWGDAQAIDETRKTHTQRPLTADELRDRHYEYNHNDAVQSNGVRGSDDRDRRSKQRHNSGKNHKRINYKICRHYNDGKCSYDSDHQQGGVVWRHACQECKLNNHRKSECRRASDNQKN
jgi:hypothetical protein